MLFLSEKLHHLNRRVQRFGPLSPFVRYGYGEVAAGGPTPARQMVNLGLVIDKMFGQAMDRIGIGFTWSDPADRLLGKQSKVDSFYRAKITPELQFGPVGEIIFDPVNHPDENTVFLWGVRARVTI